MHKITECVRRGTSAAVCHMPHADLAANLQLEWMPNNQTRGQGISGHRLGASIGVVAFSAQSLDLCSIGGLHCVV